MDFIHNLAITDILSITTSLSKLHSLFNALAVGLLFLVVPLELLRQYFSLLEGRGSYASLVVRALMAFVGLILYNSVFNFLMRCGFVIENSVLSAQDWGKFLSEIGHFYQNYKPYVLTTLFPVLFAWLASFIAIIMQAILYWIRYALLSVLYVVGPITFVLYLYEPTSYLISSWFKNVIQASLWTVVLKILVRIFIELQAQSFLAQANVSLDIITIVGINVTFLVLLIAAPFFAANFVDNHAIKPMGMLASAFFIPHTKIIQNISPTSLAGNAYDRFKNRNSDKGTPLPAKEDAPQRHRKDERTQPPPGGAQAAASREQRPITYDAISKTAPRGSSKESPTYLRRPRYEPTTKKP